MDKKIIAELELSPEEYQKILGFLGREPNLLELSIFSVMWSEHCSYKSTRRHLAKLHTKEDWVICGPGENAGIIDIGDNDAIVFKMESHNHPSFIEPYHGAATGVGGIMRDVFTMGARPIANLNSLRFGEINSPRMKYLVKNVVAAIGDYGNCMGVPTVAGDTLFHKSFNGNILVNAMCVGLAKKDKIFYAKASAIGSLVVYVGAKTGRDGIHGATMASAEFSEEEDNCKSTVQVGDPFVEKLLLEACLELMGKDSIVAIQDMGAAGLTSSSVEMCAKGNTGMDLWLDKVPMRDDNMQPVELMLSESQERMLMVIKPESEEIAHNIFKKWDLDFAVIGKITNSNHLILKNGEEICGDIPISPLSDNAPNYNRKWVEPNIINQDINFEAIINQKINQRVKNQDSELNNLASEVKIMLGSVNLASKSWIKEQYDHQVQNNTIENGKITDAGIVRIGFTSKKAIAVKTDCTPRYVYADPYRGAMQAVVENYRNLVTTGAKPLAITNCLNFGNPEKPEIMGQIVKAIEGIAIASKTLKYPVVSGNVSLYNETSGRAIYPVPNIGGVGLIEDIDFIATISFKTEGEIIFVIGENKGCLANSLYLDEIFKINGKEAGRMPEIDLGLEKLHADFILKLIKNGKVKTCHDISDGGLFIALCEMLFTSENKGIKCNVQNFNKNLTQKLENDSQIATKNNRKLHSAQKLNLAQILFSEDQARYIISVQKKEVKYLLEEARKANIALFRLGEVSNEQIIEFDNIELDDDLQKHSFNLSELQEFYDNGFSKYFAH